MEETDSIASADYNCGSVRIGGVVVADFDGGGGGGGGERLIGGSECAGSNMGGNMEECRGKGEFVSGNKKSRGRRGSGGC